MGDEIQSMLDGIQDSINNKLTSQINTKSNASQGFLKAFGVANGLLNLGQQWSTMATPADMTQYDAHLADMSQWRGQNFFNNQSLLQAYNSRLPKLALTADDLNPTTGQSLLGIGNSALTGAMTGLSVGGPWGAFIGGIAGLGGGIAADSIGRNANSISARLYNQQQKGEDALNQVAIVTGSDQAQDEQFGDLFGTRNGAMGGYLPRRQSTKKYSIYHSKCKGGTLVRLKSK